MFLLFNDIIDNKINKINKNYIENQNINIIIEY